MLKLDTTAERNHAICHVRRLYDARLSEHIKIVNLTRNFLLLFYLMLWYVNKQWM